MSALWIERRKKLLEVTILKRIRWVVSEPRIESLWARIRQCVTSFLLEQWQAGRLEGEAPDYAFFVKCGVGDTMTREDVRDGVIRVLVGVALAKSAEFELIKIALRAKAS